eukprot:g72281.t1
MSRGRYPLRPIPKSLNQQSQSGNGGDTITKAVIGVSLLAVAAAIYHPTSRAYLKKQLGLEEDPSVVAAKGRERSRQKLRLLEDLASSLHSTLDTVERDLDRALLSYQKEQDAHTAAKAKALALLQEKEERERKEKEERERKEKEQQQEQEAKERAEEGGQETDGKKTGIQGSAYYHFDSQGRKLANKWDNLDVEAELRKLDEEESTVPVEPNWAARRRGLFRPLAKRVARVKQQLQIALNHLDKLRLEDERAEEQQEGQEGDAAAQEEQQCEKQENEVAARIAALNSELREERKRLASNLDQHVGRRVDACEKQLREVQGWILS